MSNHATRQSTGSTRCSCAHECMSQRPCLRQRHSLYPMYRLYSHHRSLRRCTHFSTWKRRWACADLLASFVTGRMQVPWRAACKRVVGSSEVISLQRSRHDLPCMCGSASPRYRADTLESPESPHVQVLPCTSHTLLRVEHPASVLQYFLRARQHSGQHQPLTSLVAATRHT